MLMDSFREIVSKEKIGEENYHTPTYSTGFDIFDYRNGRIESNVPVLGIDGGRILTAIGKSGSGKTTFIVQLAKNIVENYENAQIIHMDYERAMTKARIESLTGWSDEVIKNKYMLLNRGITSESLYKIVKSISNLKLDPKNYDSLKIATDKVDNDGKVVYELPPTVVIVDSWATMVPKDISEEDELSGSMSASSIAKTNNAIIKRLTGTLEQANIILCIINHITQKIEIGFTKSQAQINYLKQDETIPGGSSCIFLANTLIKIVTSSKLTEDKEFGIKGFRCVGELIKSRSNEAGRTFDLVFSQADGFDNILTNLIILKDAGYLKGSPRAYYFEGADDIKFTLKQYKEKYLTSEKLRDVVNKLVKELYISYIPNSSNKDLYNPDSEQQVSTEEEDVELVECVDEEQDVWKGSDGKFYAPNDEGDYEEVNYEP